MKRTKQLNRREFLAGTAAVVSFPYLIPSGALAAKGKGGANERLTMAHIGVGGMGGHHLRDMVKRRNKGEVNIAAVCDADENRLAGAAKTAGKGVQPYRDYRYILERKDIDAVVIATPDHWHGVQMVHAAESGKHVYVEKPACCTIEEGKAMVAAARENKVSVQVGSQGRSQPEAYLAHRYLVNGNIGHSQSRGQ
ncbi:MAG: Gfo/Idh/MocA family protein [Planctomycetota bacterium]|jgi:predicted dehydrogenase